MKTRRLLIALMLVATLGVASTPARADWNDPIGGPGSGSGVTTVQLLLEAASVGFEAAIVAL